MATRQVLIACVFLAGCIVGGASSQFVAPVATAGAASDPGEYFCFNGGDAGDVTPKLNASARNGWELVTATLSSGDNFSSAVYCLKRRAQ